MTLQDEAIAHIGRHGTQHSDSILTEDLFPPEFQRREVFERAFEPVGQFDVQRTRNRKDSDNPVRACFRRSHLSSSQGLRCACCRAFCGRHRGEQRFLRLLHTSFAYVSTTRLSCDGHSLAISENHATAAYRSLAGLRCSWRGGLCHIECSCV